jgi:hypothetical protein
MGKPEPDGCWIVIAATNIILLALFLLAVVLILVSG